VKIKINEEVYDEIYDETGSNNWEGDFPEIITKVSGNFVVKEIINLPMPTTLTNFKTIHLLLLKIDL